VSDAFERGYLEGDQAVHREKRVSRTTFRWMTVLAAGNGALALLSLGAFASGDPEGLGGAMIMGGLSAMTLFLAVALSVSRTVVTPRALHCMIGVRTRTIPLASIQTTSLGKVNAATLRTDVAKDGAELSAFYGGDPYVRVAWTDEKDRARVTWIGSDDASALMVAIDRASSAATTRVAEVDEGVEAPERTTKQYERER
jgi:hypothetical protein